MYPGAPLPPWEKDGGQRRGWSYRGSSQDAVSRAESQALGLEGSHTESLLALRRHSHRLSLPSDSNAGPGSSVHSSRSASCWVRRRQSVSLVVLDLGLALFSNSAESQRHPRRSGKLCLILWLIT